MISRNTKESELRRHLQDAQRIVVKVGTRVLVQGHGKPDARRLTALVRDLVSLRQAGKQIVLVTSGAIGAGIDTLGWTSRPTQLHDLQMAAAVGQSRLMSLYEKRFARARLKVGQVLLTHDDLRDRVRHLNARNTFNALLRHGVVPIVNENDVVAVEDIKFGDNDVLASLVSVLIEADLLILLSTTDGLRAQKRGGKSQRISYLPSVTKEAYALVHGKGSTLSSGGMESKLSSAQNFVKAGGMVLIADGRKPKILARALAGESTGTLIGERKVGLAQEAQSGLNGRKRWIAFFHKSEGSVIVDAGAHRALAQRGKSLLPVGVKDVEGDFSVGALVNIKSSEGNLIARGLVGYSSSQIRKIKGRSSQEVKQLLGERDYDEVIHRDNLVLIEEQQK